eukprot:3442807-Lingulodinium_polyedra.AAC.1
MSNRKAWPNQKPETNGAPKRSSLVSSPPMAGSGCWPPLPPTAGLGVGRARLSPAVAAARRWAAGMAVPACAR